MTMKAIVFIFFAFVFSLYRFEPSVKRGISAWPPNMKCDDFVVLNNMTWWYDWHKNLTFFTENVVNNCPGYNVQMPEYVPMIWRKWTLGVDPGIPAGTKYILGYNEPDRADQANLTPQQAAEFWPNIEQLVNGTDIKLVSPVPASSDFVWLDQFFANCSNCKVDHLAAHFYTCNENDILGYINRLSRRYNNRKVWLTEFACPKAEYSETFMANMLKRLEKNANVFRYAWFTLRKVEEKGYVRPNATNLMEINNGTTSVLTTKGTMYNEYVYIAP